MTRLIAQAHQHARTAIASRAFTTPTGFRIVRLGAPCAAQIWAVPRRMPLDAALASGLSVCLASYPFALSVVA